MYGWTDKKGEQARKTMMFRVGKQKSGLRIEPRGFGRSSGTQRSEPGPSFGGRKATMKGPGSREGKAHCAEDPAPEPSPRRGRT